jgi:alpha-beta hydrolase superfamily lysophospholipase
LALSAEPAGATVNEVFSGTSSPVPCFAESNGVRFCSDTPRSTVKTFDGVPLDVNVALPPSAHGDPEGPYPLVMLFHGYGGTKAGLPSMQAWLDRGYATLGVTARGFGESCGTAAARAADPQAAQRYVRLADTRHEVRDAQERPACCR